MVSLRLVSVVALMFPLVLAACHVGGEGLGDDGLGDDGLGDDGFGDDGGSEILDSDGDGLTDVEEAGLGTDPHAADTDGDGFDDPTEIADGTNPTYVYSHTYAGGYNVGYCDVPPVPTGPTGVGTYLGSLTYDRYQNGDVMENFTLVDQHGASLDLYSFCGQNIMLAIGAMWCGPCQEAAAEAQAHQDELAPEGFQIIEILAEDEYSDLPDQTDLQAWADDAELVTVPVLGYGEEETLEVTDLSYQLELDAIFPTFIHIGPDMTVLSFDEGYSDPHPYL